MQAGGQAGKLARQASRQAGKQAAATMDLVQMLSAIQQGDNATRQQAEQFMKQAEESQTAPFMAALVAELGKEEQTVIIRQQAGLYFKNMLHAEDDEVARHQKLMALVRNRQEDTADETSSGFVPATMEGEFAAPAPSQALSLSSLLGGAAAQKRRVSI